MNKKLAAAVLIMCISAAASGEQVTSKPKGKATAAQAAKPMCADDVCLKLRQAVNIAMNSAKMEVIVTGDEERRKIIESAQAEMIKRTKAYRDEVRPLYAAALASVKRSEKATSALKEFMIAWNAGIDSFPMSLVLSRSQQSEDFQKHMQRLNDAWARLELEAEL